MISLRQPSARSIDAFLRRQAGVPLSYATEGMTRGASPAGYNVDHLRHRLGAGDATFSRACAALDLWRQFEQGWVRLDPSAAPPATGLVVASTARVGPTWWTNACRVVYLLNEPGPPRRVGYAYGTLVGHAECGEECFSIEMTDTGEVWYDVLAYSHPRHPLARMAYPLSRLVQKRFARGSAAAMQAAVDVGTA